MLRSSLIFAFLSAALAGLNRTDPWELKIEGGTSVTIKEYPYQASLLRYGNHFCGASIISTNWVITAAHCTNGAGKDALSVRVGSTFLNLGGLVHAVKKVKQHPKFNYYSLDYDISLLELRKTLILSPQVYPIDLPKQDEIIEDGAEAVVTGWGALSEDGTLSDQLQAVIVPVVSLEKCRRYYASTAVTDRMMCAGYLKGGKDSCQGDGGGPLIVNGSLRGIVSWGDGCAIPEYPGVYTNVVALRRYIKRVSGV